MKFYVSKVSNLRNFISEKLNITKNKSKEIIDTRNVFVNNKRVWISSFKLKNGDIVEVPDFKIDKEISISKLIIYEDDFIIVINKPSGYVSENDSKSIENILRKEFNPQIKAIHRLDKETSGVILFAKDFEIFEKFKEKWNSICLKKIYHAICYNHCDFKTKEISLPIDGKSSYSFVNLIQTNENYSFFQVEIDTGRKHQIRIHLSSIGYPILGDKLYGKNYITKKIEKEITRQMLHASNLILEHPFLDKELLLDAPFPDDFKLVLKKIFGI